MRSLPSRAIFRILLIYIVVSGLWIFFSDRWLALLFTDPTTITKIQTVKGWFFVLASGLLLYGLLKREQIRQTRIAMTLEENQQSSLVLFSSNPIPMLVYDDENLSVLAANDPALALYGYGREEFTSLTYDKILQPELPQVGYPLPGQADTQENIQHHRTNNGDTLTVQIISRPMEFNGRSAILVAIQDITEKTRLERAYKTAEMSRIASETNLRQDESRLEALTRINQIPGGSLAETTDTVLEEITQLTGSEYSFFAVLEGDLITVQVSPQIPGEAGSFQVSRVEVPQGGLIDQAMKSAEPLMIESPESIFPGILPAAGGQYQAAVPVIDSGHPRVLAGAVGRLQPYTEADLRQLALMASSLWRMIQQEDVMEELRQSQARLATAVENLPFDFWIQDFKGRFVLQNQASQEAWGDLLGKKIDEDNLDPAVLAQWKAALDKAASGRLVRGEVTYPDRPEKGAYLTIVAPIRDGAEISGTLGMNISISALKERERELAALVSIAGAMRAASNQSEMRNTILEQVMELLNIEGAALVSQPDESDGVHVDLASGAWAGSNGKNLVFADPRAAGIFRKGEIHWTGHIRTDPVMSGCPLFSEMMSGACVPLKTFGESRSALWVGSQRPLTSGQVHLLEAIADIAGSAIRRAELHEQTERHLQRMTALRAIDLAITSSLDVRLTLNILLSQIVSQLNIDGADVLLYSAHTHELVQAASHGFSAMFEKSLALQKDDEYAGQAALERRQIFIPDLEVANKPLFDALQASGTRFSSYLAQPLIAKGQVKGILEVFQRTKLEPAPDWFNFLEAVATQAAIAIDNAELFDTLQRANSDLTVAYDATIEGWSRALELRDRETQGHTQRVTRTTLWLADLMGIRDEALVNIRRGTLLHDIGKMAIPDRILLKPGPLTQAEWEIMRRHPEYAYEMLSSIPYLRASIDIPYCHHERWDGSGYPRGIGGNLIPFAARLFAVVDIWDALTTDRPYRKAWPKNKVLHYLRDQAGTRLDPEIVDVFIKHVDELENESQAANPETGMH